MQSLPLLTSTRGSHTALTTRHAFSGLAILAARALAKIVARHPQLVALAVIFGAPRLFTGAALPVRLILSGQFLFEGLGVPLHYFFARFCSHLFVLTSVAAISAAAVGPAHFSPRETLAVKLEALCPSAVAALGSVLRRCLLSLGGLLY